MRCSFLTVSGTKERHRIQKIELLACADLQREDRLGIVEGPLAPCDEFRARTLSADLYANTVDLEAQFRLASVFKLDAKHDRALLAPDFAQFQLIFDIARYDDCRTVHGTHLHREARDGGECLAICFAQRRQLANGCGCRSGRRRKSGTGRKCIRFLT